MDEVTVEGHAGITGFKTASGSIVHSAVEHGICGSHAEDTGIDDIAEVCTASGSGTDAVRRSSVIHTGRSKNQSGTGSNIVLHVFIVPADTAVFSNNSVPLSKFIQGKGSAGDSDGTPVDQTVASCRIVSISLSLIKGIGITGAGCLKIKSNDTGRMVVNIEFDTDVGNFQIIVVVQLADGNIVIFKSQTSVVVNQVEDRTDRRGINGHGTLFKNSHFTGHMDLTLEGQGTGSDDIAVEHDNISTGLTENHLRTGIDTDCRCHGRIKGGKFKDSGCHIDFGIVGIQSTADKHTVGFTGSGINCFDAAAVDDKVMVTAAEHGLIAVIIIGNSTASEIAVDHGIAGGFSVELD